MPSVLTDLQAGHVFPPFSFNVDTERAHAYLAAAGDSLPVYESDGFLPPLAIAALALGVLLESVSLPDGSLHISESLSFRGAVASGVSLECKAQLVQRSQRNGWVVSVLDSDILAAGEPVITARATVMSPQAPE